jgi:DNA-binding beta-propeller fold protein YncE
MTHDTDPTATRDTTVPTRRGADDPAGKRGEVTDPTRRRLLRTTAGSVGAGLGAGALTTGVGADETTRDVMFTANVADGTATMIDPSSYDVLGTIDLYPEANRVDSLHDSIQSVGTDILNAFARENYVEHVDVSPDGRTLYAARGHVGDVVAIDIASNELRWEHDLPGFRADHMILSPDGDFLYVSDIMFDTTVKIHTGTGWRVGGAPAHTWPHGLHLHELPAFGGDLTLINGSLGTVITPEALGHTRLTFIDPFWMWPKRTVDFEDGVRPFRVTHDGRKIYCQISKFHGFHEYDVDRDEVTRTKELPRTEHVPDDEGDYPLQSAHHGIALSGDEEYICLAGTTSWYAAVVRRSDFALVGTTHVGEHPYWVTTAPDGDHAFVAVRGEGHVSVIRYEDAEEVARIDAGEAPMVTVHGEVPDDVL